MANQRQELQIDVQWRVEQNPSSTQLAAWERLWKKIFSHASELGVSDELKETQDIVKKDEQR